MFELFAHSERAVKSDVRHLRRDYMPASRYAFGMKLRIREMRQDKGWTVEHLAELSGVSKSYMSELETGKKQINGRRLEAIAKAFNCAPMDLVDDNSVEPDILEHIKQMRQLSPADRQSVIRHARVLGSGTDAD